MIKMFEKQFYLASPISMVFQRLTKRNNCLYLCVVIFVVILYLSFHYRQQIILTSSVDGVLCVKNERYVVELHNPQLKEKKQKFRCLRKMSNDLCRTCLQGWSGRDCGIPPHPKYVKITERDHGRYIVQASVVNRELDMLKLKIENSLPYTDEFITIEGDQTSALDPGSYFVDRIANNVSSLIKLRKYRIHMKIQNKHSWNVLNELRSSNLSFHEIFEDISPTSLIIFTDSDEILRPQVLYFLKYYDAVPFPSGVDWNTYLYGYFFHDPHTIRLSSFGNVYQSPNSIRSQIQTGTIPKEISNSIHSQIPTWTIPKGGWHCSWCYKIETIQSKLISSFADVPWIAEKLEFFKQSVIYHYVIMGRWFFGDNYITRRKPTDIPENTPIYMRSYEWWRQHPPNSPE